MFYTKNEYIYIPLLKVTIKPLNPISKNPKIEDLTQYTNCRGTQLRRKCAENCTHNLILDPWGKSLINILFKSINKIN